MSNFCNELIIKDGLEKINKNRLNLLNKIKSFDYINNSIELKLENIAKNNKYKDYWKSLENQENKLSKFKDKEVIYIFYFKGIFPYSRINRNIKKIKNEDLSICRINNGKNASAKLNKKWEKLKIKTTKLHYLYVGGSSDIYNRLKQHLGYGPISTYALHLKKWWPNKEVIKIAIYDLTKIVKNKPNERQIIEDILWDKYQPLFGRKGAK